MKLSLIVPCFNEEDNIFNFNKCVKEAFKDCKYNYEIIFIDDGSKDNTLIKLKELLTNNSNNIKIISFSRNFGKEAAIYAGLKRAEGEYISIIDADLQQRPEIVIDMVNILDSNKEYDVVAAYQEKRKENKILKLFKKSFYKIINNLSNVELRSDASDFRTFRKSVKDEILKVSEYHRFSKGIFAWIGFNTCYIPYTVEKRNAGESKWSMRKLFNYAIEGIVGFSTKPLRIASLFGFFTALAAIIYSIIVIIQKFSIGIDVPGYATIVILILFLSAIELFCIGIIGEYVGRTFEQSKNRPIYIEKEYIQNNSNEDENND